MPVGGAGEALGYPDWTLGQREPDIREVTDRQRRANPTTGIAVDDVDPVLIRTRVPLHLAMRLGTRVNQLVSPFWADRSPVHRATTVALGVVDLAIARRLRSDPRLGLRLRLPLDAAELALAYATAVRDDYDEASVPAVMGCPLAVEAGARLGLKGLVVPAVNLTVGTLVRRARGQRPRTGTMAWQVAATLGGVGIAAYGRRRRRAVVAQHHRNRVALELQAEIEGRHELAVGRHVVLDDIQRATALIDLTLREPRRHNPAGEWKAELATTTRAAFAYTGDVLSGWQARHNASSPDLRTVVRLHLPPHQAAVVLARSQADALEGALSRAHLRGTVPVEVRGRRDATEVIVDGRRIVLPVPLGQPRVAFDPVPGAFLWSALWLMVAGAASREHVPRWAAAGPAAAAVAMAVGAHRLGERHGGRAPRPTVTAWSVGLTLASTVLHIRTMRNTHGHGSTSRYPHSLAMRGFALVTVLAWSELDRRHRTATVTAGAAIPALAWHLSPSPRSGRELVAELAWPLQALALGGSLVAAIETDAERLGQELRTEDLQALHDARARGRVDALEFACRSLSEAEADLADNVGDLPRDIATEVRRRLDASRRRLESLRVEHAGDQVRRAVGA